jgi:chemotaxis protein histidine kinase CheA
VVFQSIKNQALDEKRITTEQEESISDKDCGKLLFMKGFSLTENSLMKSANGNGLSYAREMIEKLAALWTLKFIPKQKLP